MVVCVMVVVGIWWFFGDDVVCVDGWLRVSISQEVVVETVVVVHGKGRVVVIQW